MLMKEFIKLFKGRIIILMIAFCSILCVLANAQEQKQILDKAEDAYARDEYAIASKLYEKVISLKRNKHKIVIYTRLADCYKKINKYKEASEEYGLLTISDSAHAENWLFYADMLKSDAKYAEAKLAYIRYSQETRVDVSEQIAGCDSAVIWTNYPTTQVIENMRSINTTKADWGAVWYGENKQIVFVSDSLRSTQLKVSQKKLNQSIYGRTDNEYQKIYTVDTIKGKGLTYIRDFAPAMNVFTYHTGPVVFNANYDSAYFTVTNPVTEDLKGEKVIKKKHIVFYGTKRLEIYLSTKDSNGVWSKAKSFAYNQSHSYSVGLAALSRNGQLLYFVSDMPGGYGGLDIWYCERRNDSTWGIPQNCGPSINTVFDEAFPTIGMDGTLYFSSKGHTGMGGFDIFRSTGSKQEWVKPVNMNCPVNSSGDDFYYITRDEKSGFFASNRAGGVGDDDIYKYALPDTIKKIIKEPFVAKVPENSQDNLKKPIHPERENKIIVTNPVIENTGDAVKFVIYFDYDRYALSNIGDKETSQLMTYLKTRKQYKVALVGMASLEGSYEYNMKLSGRRANTVAAYLVSHGINEKRITISYVGKKLAQINSPVRAERWPDRKVEVQLIVDEVK